MKCPKCDYLGFETGDTCRNCGYDFSLMAESDHEPIEIDLKTFDSDLAFVPDWPDAADNALADFERLDTDRDRPAVQEVEDALGAFTPQPDLEPAPPPPAPTREAGPPLPLFTPSFGDDDDQPLIKLPASPRPPLAVRRTPDTPRLRVVPRSSRAAEAAPVLAFDEDERDGEVAAESPGPEPLGPPHRVSRVWAQPENAAGGAMSSPGTRLAAAALDHLLLGGVDVVVIYFTTRIAGLAMGAWVSLPPAPMITFLLMLKLFYFAAFTAVGGQTIGKMAFRLRVVGEDRAPVDGTRAVTRTFAGAVSALTLGLGYIPAFLDGERRTLHDRIARTRVVTLPSS